VGWDLYDLLFKGFKGVTGKIESKPAKHFRAALGQIVNFLYTLQGEAAGAVAFSNFDTLLAPFIRYDNLSYRQVKQSLQEFLFNMAVPTRVGFQCVSEDTEILTAEGWMGYKEVKKGDRIKTFNLKTKEIENKEVKFVFKKEYQGKMYQLRNRIQDQLISPEHRVVRRKFNSDKYVLETIEEVAKLKSPLIVPIAAENTNSEAKISDGQIRLMAWIISEGTIERPGKHRCCYRVSIYQSKIKNKKNYNEIVSLLKYFRLRYSESASAALGSEVQQLRLNAEDSRKIHQWFGSKENVHFVPDYLLNLSKRQSRLFLEAYLKGDGKECCKIATSELEILNSLQIIIVNAGYGFTVRIQKPTIGKKDIYILRIINHKETYISNIEKVNYKGVIWCPHTENGTIIARRKGKVFITGNCPFTNITLDLKPSSVFAKQPVILGGKPQKEIYGEFEEEMKMFDKAFYETMLEGDASGRPFSFPIPTINITKDFPWDDPAFDSIFEASAKYGINYFANYINSEMEPSDVRSMCCRLRLDLKKLENRGGGGLFGSGSLTGSIGVVTINLPRIGYLSKTKKEFFERLGSIMDLAEESLEIKRKALENFIEKGLYPYSKFYLSAIKKMRDKYFANHFATIGLVGMNETLLNFLGEDITTRRGRKFALEVMDFMRDKLVKYQEETKNIYNLEATPAESTAYRLALADRKKYPDIIAAGTKKVPYYTNSSQLPVGFTNDAFDALKLQDDIQCKYSGGTVIHLFLGERVSDVKTSKMLVKKIFEKFHLPYITLTPTFSICPVHGYLSGEHFYCPKCIVKQPCEVYSRVVGYLRPVRQWNAGKQEEFKDRKEFKGTMKIYSKDLV
jgi:ribonucleoside-triphosphate reductase